MTPAGFTIKLPNGGIMRVLQSRVNIYIPNNLAKSSDISAIWDTGATGSAITKKVVLSLGLIPTGMSRVHTAGGLVTQRTFTVDIGLPNNVLVQGIVVTEIDALTGGADALIGMDIITLGDLSITNQNGNTCMSFRMPSLHEIDFVESPDFGVVKVTHKK